MKPLLTIFIILLSLNSFAFVDLLYATEEELQILEFECGYVINEFELDECMTEKGLYDEFGGINKEPDHDGGNGTGGGPVNN